MASRHWGDRSDMLDCLIIGGGPAGLLAAVYLGRYRRSVQVIDAGESRAAKIPESHNYPGFFGIAGPELLRRLKAQARQYGAELVSGRVTSLRKEDETFVATCSGSDVSARFILLATGLVDHCPPIEGQPADCPSEVIRFCPICDGYEAIDRRVGVLGDIKAGGKKALFLRSYTKDVSLFLTDETTEDVGSQQKLTKANVRIVRKLKQIRQVTESRDLFGRDPPPFPFRPTRYHLELETLVQPDCLVIVAQSIGKQGQRQLSRAASAIAPSKAGRGMVEQV